jgi:hypothetical protein
MRVCQDLLPVLCGPLHRTNLCQQVFCALHHTQ